MLSIGKISNSNYYCELASEDYYNNGKEPPGIWMGEGAASLGLIHGQCHIDKRDFAMVAQGFNPNTGDALMRSAGRAKRVIGHDLCFSSPKSVSLLKTIGDEATAKEIRDAEIMALRETLAYVESIVQVRKSSTQNEQAKGCVFAVYEHTTSRSVNDENGQPQLPDPQSHYHVLLLNSSERLDGKFGGIDYKTVYQQKVFLGALYRANLASNLRCAGFEIERDRGVFFRIAGVPKELEAAFSKRSSQIEAATQADKRILHKDSAKVRAVVTKDSRSGKGEFNRDEWQQSIRQEARDKFGFNQDSIKKLRDNARIKLTERSDASILRSLSKSDKPFQERDVLKLLAIDAQYSGSCGFDQIQRRCNQILESQHVSSATRTFKDRFGRDQTLTLYQYTPPESQRFNRPYVSKRISAAPAAPTPAPAAGGGAGGIMEPAAYTTQAKIDRLRDQLMDLVKAKAAIPFSSADPAQAVANGATAVALGKAISEIESAIEQLYGIQRMELMEHQQV